MRPHRVSQRPSSRPSGQVPSSEDEPAPKRQKLSASKKEESKPKHDSPPPEPAVSSADEVVPETAPENASELDPGGASEAAPLERKCPPGPPGDSHPEPSTLEGPSGLASCGGGVLTTVTMSGRDPRTAQSGASTVTAPAAAHPETTAPAEPRQDVPKPTAASVLVPKSILAKPASSPEPRYLLSVPPSPSIRCGVHTWSNVAHADAQEGRPRGGQLHSDAPPECPGACDVPGARVGRLAPFRRLGQEVEVRGHGRLVLLPVRLVCEQNARRERGDRGS